MFLSSQEKWDFITRHISMGTHYHTGPKTHDSNVGVLGVMCGWRNDLLNC